MSTRRSFASRALPWALLIAVLVVALVVGSTTTAQPSLTDRTRSVAETVRCPQCTDKSMADSDAPTAVAGREEIRRQLTQGRTPDEIRAWFTDRYGSEVLLTPSRQGLEGLIWAIPVVAFVVAAAVLGAAFLRWRRRGDDEVTPDDAARVAEALEQRHGADGGAPAR